MNDASPGPDFLEVQQRQPAGGEIAVDQKYFQAQLRQEAPNAAVRLVLPAPPLALAIQIALADMSRLLKTPCTPS
jgi:hypothetical protein